MLRTLAAYLAGVGVTYTGGAIAQTQHVLGNLSAMGAEVGMGVRLEATLHDLVGLATSYLPIIAVAFAIAFPVAALVSRALPSLRRVAYPIAGAVAILVVHLLLEAMLSITPIAAARSIIGLGIQMLFGALGGWVFLKGLGPSPANPGAGVAGGSLAHE